MDRGERSTREGRRVLCPGWQGQVTGPGTGKGPRPEAVPRPRIQSLSDLIFGLALSIGALGLIAANPKSVGELVGSLVGFGWAFLILAMVWVRYTSVMSVLPGETGGTLAANILLLFLVSIEPYLYSLITFSYNPSGGLDPEVTSAFYGGDMGAIFLILAYFQHQLSVEGRRLVSEGLQRSYKIRRNATVVSAFLFLVSMLPVFWIDVPVPGVKVPVRFALWMGTFVIFLIRRGIEKRPIPEVAHSTTV